MERSFKGVVLTKEQFNIGNAIIEKLLNGESTSLGGWAGTGKTFLLSAILNSLYKTMDANVITFTGKASTVVRTALEKLQVQVNYVGTAHSYLYNVGSYNKDEQEALDIIQKDAVALEGVDLWTDIPAAKQLEYLEGFKAQLTFTKKEVYEELLSRSGKKELIAVDEFSQINEDMAHDIVEVGVPVLWVGDIGQLRPVTGNRPDFLEVPEFMLDKVMRQALENPIIQIATNIRMNKAIERKQYNKEVIVLDSTERAKRNTIKTAFVKKYFTEAKGQGIILVNTNNERNADNRFARRLLKIAPTNLVPQVGEQIICTRNNKVTGDMNGDVFLVRENETPQGNDRVGNFVLENAQGNLVHRKYCVQSFIKSKLPSGFKTPNDVTRYTWGYAITVHKAQGSEFKAVYFSAQPMGPKETADAYRTRVYTGVTRAVEELTLVLYKKTNFNVIRR